MIVRLTGTVAEVGEGRLVVDRDGLAYEVLVCGHAATELREAQGQSVTLQTFEYLEASGMGGNLTPRLVGFLRPQDRAFFQRFITVKNLGTRKALKALVRPTGEVAAAIEAGDARQLAALPGIGKRAAEQIIAELKGKVMEFAQVDGEPATPPVESWSPDMQAAVQVLVALGERRAEVERWLQRALERHPGEHEPEEWVRLAYRVRGGTEG